MSEGMGRRLGAYEITEAVVKLYERGLTVSGAPGNAEVRFGFPMIGKPAIAAGAFGHDLRPSGDWPIDQLATAVEEALRDRLRLTGVGRPEVSVPLTGGMHVAAVGLEDRLLYDVGLRGDDGWHVIAPHAIYSRLAWNDFGIAHITDMHVAKRIDRFREVLRNAGRHDGAANLYNWNDRFRGFVRYANYLHGIGVLDVIIATGDNYDYQYEDGDDRADGGNAAFLRDLILGKAPGPEFPDVEELRLPIFLIPGNHDYRVHPYALVFDLHALGGAAGQVDLSRVPNYNGYRLSASDANVLNHYLDGRPHIEGVVPPVPNLWPHAAARMVEVDEAIPAYRQCLVSDPGSYLIALGSHRIAMVDSRHDAGMVTEILDAIRVKLGFGNENEDAFVGGSPNCLGVSDEAFDDVALWLEDPQATGVFIVGLHAPLFNPPDDRHPYFLRETQRAAQGDQVHGFLASTYGSVFVLKPSVQAQIEHNHPTWFPGPDYVKRVSNDDHLDHGVSDENADELVKRLAGVGAPRSADLVLAGHTHCFNEYRVRKLPGSDELAFYMDFYTQNPTNYYQSKFMRGWVPPRGPNDPGWKVDSADTYVEVTPDATPDASPWPVPYDALTKYVVQVPGYATPLNAAPDPRAWWDEHRPLVLQTGALGPFKRLEFFSGFRVVAVKQDVIDKIHYVSTARLEASGYRLDWEQAIQPEPGRQYQHIHRSRPLGTPAAVGVPCAYAFPANASTSIVYRDADGRLHELWQKGTERGTSDLTALASDARRASGNPRVYIDDRDGLQVILYRGTDDHVYSLYWRTGAVRRDALSAIIDAPRAHGDPVGYLGADGYRHAYYRAVSGGVHELFWTGTERPGHGNLSPDDAAPIGDMVAYQKPTTGENNVIYRATDRHIHRLAWITGTPHAENLSSVAGAPSAAGDPAGYYTRFDDVHQIVYRGEFGQLHELWWQGENRVSYWNLTAAASAPAAARGSDGDPVTYYSAGTNTKHVIYRSEDGHLHELSWTPGGSAAPAYVDLTLHAVAPLAADKPAAYVVAPNTHHVVYRGTDDQIHEIRWSTPAAFILEEAIRPHRWG